MNCDSFKVILPGGAGLVGQNLTVRLKARGFSKIVVLDKHAANLDIMRRLHPELTIEYADLSQPGEWRQHFSGATAVVMLQAQIGGIDLSEFERNNLDATRHVLDAIQSLGPTQLIHISSSVVNASAEDFYTRTKIAQEQMVLGSGLPALILRPTLMFGWFDRKHLGWLSRFMTKVPIFPIPGNGKFRRQPLYVGDFCDIIISSIASGRSQGIYNISGHEMIDYIDIIREIRGAIRARTLILRIPYPVFYSLLWTWSRFDRNPPFTTQQLQALSANDEFEVIDWPTLFGVRSTPFKEAVAETFCDPLYSHVTLSF